MVWPHPYLPWPLSRIIHNWTKLFQFYWNIWTFHRIIPRSGRKFMWYKRKG